MITVFLPENSPSQEKQNLAEKKAGRLESWGSLPFQLGQLRSAHVRVAMLVKVCLQGAGEPRQRKVGEEGLIPRSIEDELCGKYRSVIPFSPLPWLVFRSVESPFLSCVQSGYRVSGNVFKTKPELINRTGSMLIEERVELELRHGLK